MGSCLAALSRMARGHDNAVRLRPGIIFLRDAAGPYAVLGALLSVAGGFAYTRKDACGPRAEQGCLPSK